jgi:hypothetical protein
MSPKFDTVFASAAKQQCDMATAVDTHAGSLQARFRGGGVPEITAASRTGQLARPRKVLVRRQGSVFWAKD